MGGSSVQAGSGATKARKRREGGRAPFGFWALGVATGVVLGVALPTGLLLAIGLLPAALAALADRSPGRWTARSVLVFNLAGLVPSVRTLWLEGHTLATLAGVLARLDGLPLAYGSAAVGAVLPVVASWAIFAVLEARAAVDVTRLEQKRAALRETWGEEVDQPAGLPSAKASAPTASG